MNVEIKDFVGIFENAYSKEYCDKVIQYFETCHANGCSKTRQREVKDTLKTDKNDTIVWGDIGQDGELTRPFNATFWECYGLYADKYDVLKGAEQHNNYAYKVQRTEVGEGYHVWHFEADGVATSRRLLTWILYLNDVEEGGETEFLYYPKRIKPKAGTLIIWPGAYTHTHRGNQPLSNTKYIVTGWVEF